MYKITKKNNPIYSLAALAGVAVGGGGGPPPPANIFTPSTSPLGLEDNNSNLSFRVICTAAIDSLGKLKVTFSSASTAGLDVSHASIGKWDGTASSTTTTVPVELKFSGNSGFSIGANSSITSDACDHSATFTILTGNGIVTVFDIPVTTANGQKRQTGLTNAETWYSNPGQVSWNVASPTGMGFAQIAATDYAIELIDTE